jgi:chromosomal replication initiator protein
MWRRKKCSSRELPITRFLSTAARSRKPLLHAVMYETKKSFSDFNIIYLRGDDFTNQFILAMQKGDLSEFKKKYRAADMLLVDDIQFVAGKETTQEEFFHTFNALYEGKKQIVLTSDRPPKELASLEERLVSRFESGLLVDIQPPDFETRIAIIKRKAFVLGVDIPENVLLFVANNVKTNIRQLEGAVKKLKAFSQLTGVAIDLNIAQVAVRDMFSQIRQNIVTVDDIIAEISKFYNISVDDIKSKKRTSEVAFARQVAMYIAREMTDLSTQPSATT